VRGDEVEQDADSSLTSVGNERVEVGERAEVGVHVAVVGDVVAPVLVRRREGGVQPDAVDTEPLEVVETIAEPDQVSDPVVRRVRERARVDLIEHAGAPPGLRGASHGQR
jgi:hypothetical protein